MTQYEIVPHGVLFAVRVVGAREPISVHATRREASDAVKRYEAADSRRAAR